MTLQETTLSLTPSHIEEDDPHFLEKEIGVLESTAFHWLTFSPKLEEQFEAATVAPRTARMLMNGILSIVLYNLFLISDYQIRPDNFSHFLVVRLGFATPPALLAVALLRLGVSKKLRESMVVVICSIFAISILYLYFGESAVVSAYAMTDLVILILFTNIGFHLRLAYAFSASLICVVLGLLFVQMDVTLNASQKFEGVAILLAGTLLSLVANYSLERGERLSFLLNLRSEGRAVKLAATNEHLLRLSNEDRLTQLPNRRRFDQLYKQLWQECARDQKPLSIIMIDIDNFKDLNDRYGHLYGDAVLSRVAALLQPALRVQGDFVARYGGEEFVMVLPGASTQAAHHVAERVRMMVELAGSPPPTKDGPRQHGWATVSCGVGTALPRRGVELLSPIEAADKALYRAKAEGRNRVCC